MDIINNTVRKVNIRPEQNIITSVSLTAVGLVHQLGAVWEPITDHAGFNADCAAGTLPQSTLRAA